MRCPLVMSEDLLCDLTEYRSHCNKSVMMAARSHLYRDLDRDMLPKKDRVRWTARGWAGDARGGNGKLTWGYCREVKRGLMLGEG